mmetsp:Transcript_4531/g.8104  ORF Transcript_4531/g.8104 Transcript_4531/m.8104 type:complete len:200 (+) Transcript_4531:836-1435(+)
MWQVLPNDSEGTTAVAVSLPQSEVSWHPSGFRRPIAVGPWHFHPHYLSMYPSASGDRAATSHESHYKSLSCLRFDEESQTPWEEGCDHVTYAPREASENKTNRYRNMEKAVNCTKGRCYRRLSSHLRDRFHSPIGSKGSLWRRRIRLSLAWIESTRDRNDWLIRCFRIRYIPLPRHERHCHIFLHDCNISLLCSSLFSQ